MLGRRTLAAAIITAVATALVVAGASDAVAPNKKKTVKLTVKLSGQNEVPPADPDGSGRAEVQLKLGKGRVCFEIKFQRIENPIMAHIHKGAKGVNGDIKVLFFDEPMGVSSPAEGCVDAKKKLMKKIARKPKRWYVNVHTPDYPSGAIRGQLKGGGAGEDSGGGGNGGGGTGGGGPY